MEGFKHFKLRKEEYDFSFSFKNKINAFQTVRAQHVLMALEDLKKQKQNTTRIKLLTNTARSKLL